MFKKQLSPFLVTPLAAVLLIACGRVDAIPNYNIVELLTPPPRQDVYPTTDPSWTPMPGPTATPSPTPRPLPSVPATGSIFLGWVGSGPLGSNQLVNPHGLAFAAGSLFVADAGRTGLLGQYGAVLRFDPVENRRLAMYQTRTSSTSLPVDLAGVAVSTVSAGVDTKLSFVWSASPWAVFGHVADKLWPLNLGAPYAPGGVDVAVVGDRAWVAERDAVRAYKLPWWTPDHTATDLEIKGVRGIGLQDAEVPWVAAGGKVYRGAQEFAPAAGAPAPADPRDVAVDHRFPVAADGGTADIPAVPPEEGQSGSDPFAEQPAAPEASYRSVLVLERTRVVRYGPAGEFLGALGEGRIEDGRSLAIGDDGSVYVSDGGSRRVYRFSPP